LEKELAQMRLKMSFLVRAVSQPQTMSESDQQQLRFMLLEEAAKQAHMQDSMDAPNPAALPSNVGLATKPMALASLTPVSVVASLPASSLGATVALTNLV
jgi:hypothetical protein